MGHLFSFIRGIAGLAAFGVMLSIVACDRRSDNEQKRAATDPVQAAAALPASRPSSCVMTIDGVEASFPGARLRLQQDNDEWTATFFSDDPAEAIRPDYQGNSFYLSMQLTGVEDGKLNGARWSLQNPEKAEGDAPEGIFIRGQQQQLRPLNVKAEFQDQGTIVIVNLSGEFQGIDTKDAGTTTRKAVQARVEAACERK